MYANYTHEQLVQLVRQKDEEIARLEKRNEYHGIPDDVVLKFGEHRTVTDLGTTLKLCDAVEGVLKECGY